MSLPTEWVSDYCLMPNEPLFSYIMWEQVTICQLHVYHVRTSYNLSAISCENKLHFSAVSCENKLQFVSCIMWEQVTFWWDDDVCIVLDCNQIFINHMESLFLFIVTKIRRGTVRQGRFGQNVVQWWRLSRLDSIDIHFLMI